MRTGQALLPEFDEEMATTRRLLERVPNERMTWKPHEKSFALGHLTQLIARMPGWITNVVTARALDLSSGAPYTFETPAALLDEFDRNVQGARTALDHVSDDDLAESWSLRHGERVLFSAPRRVVVRQTINHLVHHRGQLSVYLRLIDVPLPSIYGPTADDRTF
ncbi:MAG: DinB family protein [Vicinamibacterales bacterium]